MKVNNQTEKMYPGIDDGLVPLHEHLSALLLRYRQMRNEFIETSVEEIRVEMPIELDVLVESDGRRSLTSSPPLHYIETGYENNLHQMRVTIALDEELLEALDE